MADVNLIHLALVTQPADYEPDNVDLIRRYCPGLAQHTHEQVARHVQVDEQGCWPWDGGYSPQGYGTVGVYDAWHEYSTMLTHRYFYSTLVGPIPVGHDVHHRCEHKPCWHPLHLEAVTPTEHKARHRR